MLMRRRDSARFSEVCIAPATDMGTPDLRLIAIAPGDKILQPEQREQAQGHQQHRGDEAEEIAATPVFVLIMVLLVGHAVVTAVWSVGSTVKRARQSHEEQMKRPAQSRIPLGMSALGQK